MFWIVEKIIVSLFVESLVASKNSRNFQIISKMHLPKQRNHDRIAFVVGHFAQKIWLHGQAVKTSPFHGGNTGSNPVGVIIWRLSQVVRRGTATP